MMSYSMMRALVGKSTLLLISVLCTKLSEAVPVHTKRHADLETVISLIKMHSSVGKNKRGNLGILLS